MARRKKGLSDPTLIRNLLHEGRLSLADACRAIRALHGVSQDEFARRFGINRKVVKDLEGGRGNPRRESLDRIAGAAGLRVALVANRAVAVMDSRERLAEEEARRAADANALRQGASARELYQRNAMSLGGVELHLPKIA